MAKERILIFAQEERDAQQEACGFRVGQPQRLQNNTGGGCNKLQQQEQNIPEGDDDSQE